MSTNHRGIVVDGLVRTFKGDIHAVDGIDLEVAAGEIYGFLGPNGAGKSTTVHMLTTLLPPTAGRATVAGFDIAAQGADVRRHIGAALQDTALDNFLTGREHMDLQGGLNGLPKADRARRGTELLERVGLTEAAERKVGGYSGGMKRRLDLALALVHGPSILFLDEPTTGLDPQSRSALWDEVERLARQDGVTVFLTTQYLEEADVLADRVGIIDRGKIVAEGTPDELKREIGGDTVEAIPADPHDLERAAEVLAAFGQRAAHSPKGAAVRLGHGAEQLPDIVRALDEAGIALAHLQLHSPSLDDVFLAKTGRSLEGAGEGGGTRRRPRRLCRRDSRARPPGRVRGAPLSEAHAAPAGADRADARLPALPARRQRERAGRGHEDPRLPDQLLSGLRDHRHLHPGGDVRGHHRGHRARDRHRHGLPRPPAAHAVAAGDDPRRPDGRGHDPGPDRRAGLPRRRHRVRGRHQERTRRRGRARALRGLHRRGLRRASARRWAPAPVRPRPCRVRSRSCSPSSSCRR